MNISELARQTGASLRSLRYYEAKQLLSPKRGENGYRCYDSTAIGRVRMIQLYLGLGLSTNEIFDLTGCCGPEEAKAMLDGPDLASCPGEIELYEEKLAQIESHIASLEKARTFLKQRLARVQGRDKPSAVVGELSMKKET